jgi:peptidoglycan/xylan/chitin deacetylase (PgdA/CDA1 family)
MKIIQVGAISTGTVILLGLALVIPAFLQPPQQLLVLLSFSVLDQENTQQWCKELSSILSKQNVKAVVFVAGSTAEQYSECVSDFSNNVDIGSQTYDYVELTSISDYQVQLDQVKRGKIAVDRAGNLDSKLFKAPFGSTDENIYSLLNSSGILADFSYQNQYNKYYEDQFIKFDLVSYEGLEESTDYYQNLKPEGGPVVINFDNQTPVEKIDQFVSKLKSSHIRFVSASELTGIDLTVKEGEWRLP